MRNLNETSFTTKLRRIELLSRLLILVKFCFLSLQIPGDSFLNGCINLFIVISLFSSNFKQQLNYLSFRRQMNALLGRLYLVWGRLATLITYRNTRWPFERN
jgi:hypothetical protein